MLNMGNSVRELCDAFSLPTDIYYNHCIYRNNFKSEVEFKKELDSYIYFYSNKREQHYLKYLSPAQFELQMT